MPKKAAGENSKKAAGNARKAEAAAQKQAAANAKLAKEEDAYWEQGSKTSSKKDAAEAKKAEAARKKAEREALLKEEEASQPSRGKGAGAKTAAQKKQSRGLDLSQLDDTGLLPPGSSRKAAALNASGIENALDALELTESGNNTKIDRHPERRFKAAYAAFEARRLPEIEVEFPGLRKQQRVEICKKEFEKSEENPFNKVNVAFDATREEVAAVREAERRKVEARLTAK